MRKQELKALVAASLLFLGCTTGWAMVVREGGAGSVAGLLEPPGVAANDYWFDSSGQEIIFIDLDAAIYAVEDAHDHEESSDATISAHDEETGGGCSGGGSGGGLFIEVYKANSSVQAPLCAATKPKSPGWENDPRLACYLEEAGAYMVKVGIRPKDDHDHIEEAGSTSEPKIVPYLLNVSMRAIADETELDAAIKGSRNQLQEKIQ